MVERLVYLFIYMSVIHHIFICRYTFHFFIQQSPSTQTHLPRHYGRLFPPSESSKDQLTIFT